MYAQQSAIDPSLAALLQTAQMVTPDQTPTVAAQVAQAAQQKMQPQGIMQGMPQARQDYANAAPSMMRNMQQQQMQQMVRQAMQPQPAGIEGLPAPNMQGMAEGGVVGFAGDGEFGSLVPNAGAMTLDELRIEEDKRKRQEDYQRQKAANEAYRANIARQKQEEQQRAQLQFLEDSAPQVATAVRQQMAASSPQVDFRDSRYRTMELRKGEEGVAEKIGTVPLDKKPEIQFLTSSPGPRPSAQPAAAPVTGIAALAGRPTYDAASIPAAGAPYITTGEGNVTRLREAEGKRAEFEKTLPDLSAKGIEALRQRMTDVERAEASRKESLGLDRVIQQLLGGMRGPGGVAGADIQFMNAQRAAEDAFSQAKLGNQQAQLLLEKAQQERQLGRFDRAIALEREASALMEKAQDNALKAQESRQRSVGAQFTGDVQMRGQDMEARNAELNREANRKLEEYRRQTQLMKPKEQDNVVRLESLKLQQLTNGKPETASPVQKAEALEYAIKAARGTGVDEKAEFAGLRQEAIMLNNELKTYLDAPDPRLAKSPRVAEIQRELDNIRRKLGGGAPAPTGGGTVDKNNPLLK